MNAEDFVARLEKAKRTATGWIARCPAHPDRLPSLAVRALDDGRILVHCFAGCDVGAIVSALGIELSDLFPPKPIEHDYRPALRRAFNAHDVLEAVASEAGILALYACDYLNGTTLTQDDKARILTSAQLLAEARRIANG